MGCVAGWYHANMSQDQDPPERFDFELEPMVHRRSVRMGIQKRVFSTRVRQVGALRPRHNVAATLKQGRRGALERLLRD